MVLFALEIYKSGGGFYNTPDELINAIRDDIFNPAAIMKKNIDEIFISKLKCKTGHQGK